MLDGHSLGRVRLTPGGVTAVTLLAAMLVPLDWVQDGPLLCPFRLLTGLPCPGCGMTRSVVALAHGDLQSSLFYHPLGVVVAAVGSMLVLADVMELVRRQRAGIDQSNGAVALLDGLAVGPVVWGSVVVLLGVWAVRLPLHLAGSWSF
jgi:hypothetical protein